MQIAPRAATKNSVRSKRTEAVQFLLKVTAGT